MARIALTIWLCCLVASVATAAPWSKTFAPADLHLALSGGGKAHVTSYRGGDVLQVDLSAQPKTSRFGEATWFDATPGKYRAIFKLSIQCPSVGRVNDVELVVMHGDTVLASRPMDLALLPVDGSQAEIPLQFTIDKATADQTPIGCLLRWSNRGDLTLLRHHGITIERLNDGPAITQLTVDKLIYRPGQPGTAHVRLHNYAAVTAKGSVALALINELADRTELPPLPFELAAGADASLDIPFKAPGEWGVRAEAVLTADGVTDRATDYFSVTNNYFAVGIGYPAGPITTGDSRYESLPTQMRAAYANMLEIFFWAPCDWAKLTSARAEWWSGQTSYHETEAGLQSLIGNCHQLGIKVAGYCSQNAAGPEGWEVARRHPEWFYPNQDGSINGAYDVFNFDHWNDTAWRAERAAQKAEALPWYALNVDLRKLPPLDYGIDQIIAGHKQYGWDAMRFDGHYRIPGNDEMSARNMRRLKERVAAACPELLLGYNYGLAPDYTPGCEHEIRETMAGGGLYMQEGIRSLRYAKERYTSWQHYATNELHIAKFIQSLGGYYHCIWDLNCALAGKKAAPNLERGLYIFLYGIIAGGHPYYGTHQDLPGCDNWGAFLTRWSSMLWDRNLHLVPHPETQFAVAGKRVEWQPFVQERVVSPKRKFIILHLVTPPDSDSIDNTPPPLPKFIAPSAPVEKDAPGENGGADDPEPVAGDAATAPPWGNEVRVNYTPEPGATIIRTVLVRPESTPYDSVLVPQPREGTLHFAVPHPRYWSMVIIELTGNFPAPATLPQYAEPPNPAKLTVTDGPPIAFHNDPLKGNQAIAEEGVQYVLLDRSSCNIGNNPVPDKDSDLSVVQWRETGHTNDKIGIWWALGLEAGKYRCSIRLKWTDAKAIPTPQKFWMHMIGHEGVSVNSPVYVTPGAPNAPAGARTFGERGKYQYYDLGVIELKQYKLVTFDGYANSAQAGDNALYADRIKIELIERYGDDKLAEWNPLEKPAGLRTPNGAHPRKVLQVKGLFWQQYGLDKVVAADSRYDLNLPDYPYVYGYDAIVLTDATYNGSAVSMRQMLRDFVQDGGRLVILGGPMTLGFGRMRYTMTDAMLPVLLTGDHEVARCDPPLLLGPAANVAYPDKPAVYWLHDLQPRPGANVLAYAGSHPIALAATHGKGQVIVFTGTVLGEGTEISKPFWESASWTGLLKRMVME